MDGATKETEKKLFKDRVKCTLKSDELVSYGKQLAGATQDLAELEEEREHLNAEIKARQKKSEAES